MPEVCEVAHIVNQIKNLISENSKLISTEILSGRYKRHGHPQEWDIFNENLPLKWKDINFKGKFIYFTFVNKYKDNFYIWNTLSMSGGWSLRKMKHSHVKFKIKEKNCVWELFFNDPRCFGTFNVSFHIDEMNNKLNTIGISWLNGNKKSEIGVKENEFLKIIEKFPDKNICLFLISQTKISGIGNYLLSEILYDSKINPFVLIKDIPKDKLKNLYKSATKIITSSYQLDGVSLKDYCGIYGEKGEYQNCLQVYNKKITPNNEKVIKKTGPHKRSIYFVSNY